MKTVHRCACTPCAVALGLACLAVVGGCASPLHRGFEAFQAGDCKTAYENWRQAAQAGDAAGKYNLGVLYQRGCPAIGLRPAPKTALAWYTASAQSGYPHAYAALGDYYRAGVYLPRDDNKAIANYHYAARWGSAHAANGLRSMNVPVPAADLLESSRQQERQQERDDNDAIAILIGSALLGAAQGYSDAVSAPYGPTQSYRPASTAAAGDSYQATQIYIAAGCTSDFSCGMGKVCVKPQFQSTGVCLQSVNSVGTPQVTIPSPSSVLPNTGLLKRVCRAPNVGCPVGFTCDEALNACVK